MPPGLGDRAGEEGRLLSSVLRFAAVFLAAEVLAFASDEREDALAWMRE